MATQELVNINGSSCNVTTWLPRSSGGGKRQLVVVFHGFLAHANYPTVRYAAELLQQHIVVVAADMPGHGKSPGTVGYMKDAVSVTQWAAAVIRYAVEQHQPDGGIVLLGSSLGGALALLAAQEVSSSIQIDGIVLLAPMLGLKNVSALERNLLYGLTRIVPNQWALIPSSATDAAKQYRDAEKRKECEELAGDTKYLCLGSAYTCIDLVQRVQTAADTCSVPVWMGIADEDVVVDPDAALSWFQRYESSSSNDKEGCVLKRYPALHGLLCEPSPLVDQIQDDVVQWVQGRCKT